MEKTYKDQLNSFLDNALREDVGSGDHSSLASIPQFATGKASLYVKDHGIIAGIDVARFLFRKLDPEIQFDALIADGTQVMPGDIAFSISGKILVILKGERLALNIMQRMSGIATQTRKFADKLEGLKTKVVDTRKTTPGMRFLEKQAVLLGGGENHRMGLYDMIMIKDNHIDYAGGIKNVIERTKTYLQKQELNLKIEVEARKLDDVIEILQVGGIDRIMFDNFSLEDTKKAVDLIGGKVETESSGGITLETIRDYAECGVDYISVGGLTHQIRSLDLSLKAILE